MIHTNIKRFISSQTHDSYRGHDGWEYPIVAFIEDGYNQKVAYNQETVLRWFPGEGAKSPVFRGDVSVDNLRGWIGNNCWPCEVNKTTGELTYLNASNLATNPNRENPEYLQMVEIRNVNVGFFQNESEGWREIRFNYDHGCPRGFHKWFAHPTWNNSKGCFTKLIGRYDILPNADGTTIDVCAGKAQSSTAGEFKWSSDEMLKRIKATGTAIGKEGKLLAMTYWEQYVLSLLFCVYHKTFNAQSIYKGLVTGDNANGDMWVKGQTDSITTQTGELSDGGGYKFLHIENAVHGAQWLWGAGWTGNNSTNPTWYFMTFDDLKANIEATLQQKNCDMAASYRNYPYNSTGLFITDMDVLGVPIRSGSSNTSGFYDSLYSNVLQDNRLAYFGGSSSSGNSAGCWAKNFNFSSTDTDWGLRGRLTMLR